MCRMVSTPRLFGWLWLFGVSVTASLTVYAVLNAPMVSGAGHGDWANCGDCRGSPGPALVGIDPRVFESAPERAFS